jgi:hypothetical protein
MRKYASFLGSQRAPGIVPQSMAPGAETVRGAVVALPYAFQYESNTVLAK